MPYIATNYTSARQALDEIAQAVTRATLRAETGANTIRDQSTVLAALATASPAGWLDVVQYIDAQAAAFPADTNWQTLKDEKDQIVTDFQAEKTRIDGIIAAIDAA